MSGPRKAALARTGAAPVVVQERGGPLAAGAGLLIVASVVPLSLLQLPNMMGLGLPAGVIAGLAGQDGPAGLIRAAGLALPVMAGAAPVAAVLARRHRAWPVLLAGLILIGAADLLGNSVHSVLGIALDRALHGLGAGTALPASLALGWERPPRWRRLLSRWWVAVAVLSLLGSVPLMRDRLAGGDWRAALQPFPWLTVVALAATAVYIAVTGGSGPPPRSAVTPAERTQLALLAVPLAGLGALDLGVSGQSAASVTASAGVALFILAGMALVTSADAVTGGVRGRLCFPLIGAWAGFTLAPTAGAIAGSRLLALPLAAAAVAGAAGTGIDWLSGRHGAGAGDGKPVTGGGSAAAARDGQPRGNATRAGRPGSHAARHKSTRKPAAAGPGGNAALRCVLAGLTCAAAGLIVAPAAGLIVAPAASGASPTGLAAVAAYALLGGGVTMALSAGITDATPAGAMSGLSLGLAGSLTGYLVAGAIQIRLASSLARAVSWWEGAAAAAALATAGGVFLLGRARRDQEEVAGRG